MGVSIIILTYNKLEYTKECIESIRKYTTYIDYEIIVIDNNSTDDTINYLKQQNDIKLILNKENVGFPKGCNQGIEIANKDYDILLLNNDTVVTTNYLNNLYYCLHSDKNIGAVGPVTNSASYAQSIAVNYNDIEQMHKFSEEFNHKNSNLWEERIKLIGFCMLIKREVINKVGLLDERFTPGNFEDDDYSMRIIKSGYKIILCKDTFVHHFGGASFNRDSEFARIMAINQSKFEQKWNFTHNELALYTYFPKLLDDLKYSDNKNILEVFGGCGATGLYIKNKYKNTNYFVYENNKNVKSIVKNVFNLLDEENINQSEFNFEYSIIKNPYRFLSLDNKIIKKIITSSKGVIVFISERENREAIINKTKDVFNKYGYEIYKDYKYYDENGIYLSTLVLSNKMKNIVKDDLVLETKFELMRIDNKINIDDNIEKIGNKILENIISIDEIKNLISANVINKEDVSKKLGLL